MTTYRPLHDNVLVQLVETERTTKTGLIIPNEGVLARVVAVGGGRYTDSGVFVEPRVRVGEIVSLPKHFDQMFSQENRLLAPIAAEILVDDQKHFVIAEKHLLGVIDGWKEPKR